MNQQTSWTLGLVSAFFLSGCGLIKSVVKHNADERREKLVAADDYETLKAECDQWHSKNCEAKQRVAAKRLDASTCDNLLENFGKYYNSSSTKEDDIKITKKLHDCGFKEQVLMELSVRWKTTALLAVEKQGGDFFGPFVEYLASDDNRFAGDSGFYRAQDMAAWLIKSADAERCAPVDAHMAHIAVDSRGPFLSFFAKVGCGALTVPHSMQRLSSKYADQRVQACQLLGDFGDESALDKLDILAESDPFKQEREVQTSQGRIAVEVYFPVRETCRGAAGKVRLRQ